MNFYTNYVPEVSNACKNMGVAAYQLVTTALPPKLIETGAYAYIAKEAIHFALHEGNELTAGPALLVGGGSMLLSLASAYHGDGMAAVGLVSALYTHHFLG